MSVAASKWIVGARPKTLPAAIVPVFVGTGVAEHFDAFVWDRSLLALIVALGMQVAVNYANDYSDGVRGTDEIRSGPLRLVGSGLATPAAVKRAAFVSFGVAIAAGIVLSALASWWLIILGAACVAAAWFYTGGKTPYGYRGFGEVSVFLFFGLATVMGTAYVQMERVTLLSLVAAIPVGLLAMALLVVNNLRDRENDARSGKLTLAVHLGDARTRALYSTCVFVPFLVTALTGIRIPMALIALLAFPLAFGPARHVRAGESGRDLIAVLQQTGRLQLVYGALFAIGLAF